MSEYRWSVATLRRTSKAGHRYRRILQLPGAMPTSEFTDKRESFLYATLARAMFPLPTNRPAPCPKPGTPIPTPVPPEAILPDTVVRLTRSAPVPTNRPAPCASPPFPLRLGGDPPWIPRPWKPRRPARQPHLVLLP